MHKMNVLYTYLCNLIAITVWTLSYALALSEWKESWVTSCGTQFP